MKRIVPTGHGVGTWFPAQKQEGGDGGEHCTITLSLKGESLPGSTKCFKAWAETHWNQQRLFPFIAQGAGGGYNLKCCLKRKVLPVLLPWIINNTTKSTKCPGIPPSSSAVTFPCIHSPPPWRGGGQERPFFNLFLKSHTKIRLPNKHKNPFLPLVPHLVTGNKHRERGEKQSARLLAHRCFTYYRHRA